MSVWLIDSKRASNTGMPVVAAQSATPGHARSITLHEVAS